MRFREDGSSVRGSVAGLGRIGLAAIGVLCGAAAGCAGSSLPAPGTMGGHGTPEAVMFAPFVQSLDGTALSFDMVPVPGGIVTAEQVEVEVPPFWIGRTEVTWDLYDVFVFELDKDEDEREDAADSDGTETDALSRPSKPYIAPDLGFGHNGYAAISLSYQGADHFCRWLSMKTGRSFRLPTEQEWRLACRLGAVPADELDAYAWYEDNADFTPHPVASKRADQLGCHDLWGNISEWCTGADGKPVAMGGNYLSPADETGCAGRMIPTPDWQMTDPQVPKSPWWLSDAGFVGFRIVCVPGGQRTQPSSGDQHADTQQEDE